MALTISASLAQIGEFSFILAGLGVALGLMPPMGRDLVLAGALVSIVLNPLVFMLTERLGAWWKPQPAAGPAVQGHAPTTGTAAETIVAPQANATAPTPRPAAVAEPEAGSAATARSGHVVLAGFGRVGATIGKVLSARGVPTVVIEDADDRVEAARQLGLEVIVGNAARPEVLAEAGLAQAQAFILAIPNAFEAGQAVEQARRLNPTLKIAARAHSDEEEAYLLGLGADTVVLGEREIGLGMADWLMGVWGEGKSTNPPARL
jgi:CPA2 family monovalent cation:H+ antiporter-2